MPDVDITLHYVIETAYAVLFDKENTYEEVSADRHYAFQGETVTVTGTPDNSVYAHDQLACTVRSGSGEIEVTITEKDGTYTATFTMPEVQVTVTPEFQMEPVSYTEYSYSKANGLTSVRKTIVRYFPLLASHDDLVLTDGDYVVAENTTFGGRVTVAKGSTVNLVVKAGATLTCKGLGCGYDKNGQYATLNLFGDGRIESTAYAFEAGIGSAEYESNGNITFHIASVEATDGNQAAGIGGGRGSGTRGVYITGGTVTASTTYKDSHGAGIGGGEGGGNTREIVISGGNVTATGAFGAAGIGGGDEANMKGTIRISGYSTQVKATGGMGAGGIGAGRFITSGGDMRGTIIIDCGAGSRIEATGNGGLGYGSGTGIGEGHGGNMTGEVIIHGGNLYITAGDHAAGIGGGSEESKNGGEGDDVTINGGYIEIINILSGAEASGHGDDDSKSGTVRLPDHLRVTVGGEPVNVPTARINATAGTTARSS